MYEVIKEFYGRIKDPDGWVVEPGGEKQRNKLFAAGDHISEADQIEGDIQRRLDLNLIKLI